MKKYTFSKYMCIILIIIMILQVVDLHSGKNFFDLLFIVFMFISGVNIGANLELE